MNKHFIFTGSRSGSNYLVNLLNTHPQITNYGEVLGKWTLLYKLHSRFGLGGKSTLDYLNYIYTSKLFFTGAQIYSLIAHLRTGQTINFKQWSQVKTIGVKDFFMNLSGDQSYLWSFFKEDDQILIINLYRENLLKKHISLVKMSSTKIISSRDLNSKHQLSKLYVNIQELLETLERGYTMLQKRMELLDALPKRRVLHIRYEDLFASASSQNYYRDLIFKFLGVEPIPVESDHKKLLSKELSDTVENYDEVYNALKDTKFAHYLNSKD
ncbi:MAG: hypothetical protein SWJ54_10980 [Cyanobacteriota bacterium]|nr:hypothetical protein [Cyanobacteriota bacterium]